jgi:hypothetical protein
MPNAVSLGDLIQVKLYTYNGTQQGINVLHYVVTSRLGLTVNDQHVASQMDINAALRYKAYMPASCEYLGTRVQIIAPVPFPAVIATAQAGVGTQANDPLPPMASMLISTRTNVTGPKGRGRVYLPFWGEGQSDIDGKPSAAAMALATAWGNDILDSVTVANGADSIIMDPIVYSKVTPAARNVMTTFTVKTQWATQRRRGKLNKADTRGPQP